MAFRVLIVAAALAAGIVLAQQQTRQNPENGVIEGTIVREGTTDPIPGVHITVAGRTNAGMTPEYARWLLEGVGRGIGNPYPQEALQELLDVIAGKSPPPGAAAAVSLSATSDSDGHFTFKDVPPGPVVVRARLLGYFGLPTGIGDSAVEVTSRAIVERQQTTNVRLSMIPGSSISGRVVDPDGNPRQNAAVQIFRVGYALNNGEVQLSQFTLGQKTNDRGEYRLYQLPPGEYRLAVTPLRITPSESLRRTVGGSPEVLARTFYPNSIDPFTAVPINLRGGEELGGMDIRIRSAPAAKVTGRIISALPAVPAVSPADPVRQLAPNIMLLRHDVIGLGMHSPSDPAITINLNDGSFEIQDLTPGLYDLYARLPVAYGWSSNNSPGKASEAWAFGRTTIDVRTPGMDGVVVAVRPGTDLRGKVIVDGKATVANIGFALTPDDSAVLIGGTDTTTMTVLNQIMRFDSGIGSDGSFAIPLVPEGRYRFQVGLNPAIRGAMKQQPAEGQVATNRPLLPANAYVADVRQDGRSVFDEGIRVGSESTVSVELVINTNGGSIEGTVVQADQKPAANAVVVLVPPENRRRNPALYKTAISDAQGHFALSSLPPGSYRIFAWQSIPPAAYLNPQFIRRYEERGTTVTVTGNTRVDISLDLIAGPAR